jgi:hypothetical protein
MYDKNTTFTSFTCPSISRIFFWLLMDTAGLLMTAVVTVGRAGLKDQVNEDLLMFIKEEAKPMRPSLPDRRQVVYMPAASIRPGSPGLPPSAPLWYWGTRYPF